MYIQKFLFHYWDKKRLYLKWRTIFNFPIMKISRDAQSSCGASCLTNRSKFTDWMFGHKMVNDRIFWLLKYNWVNCLSWGLKFIFEANFTLTDLILFKKRNSVGSTLFENLFWTKDSIQHNSSSVYKRIGRGGGSKYFRTNQTWHSLVKVI